MTERRAPAECANCGAALPPRARACPACGADERTGWRDSADSVYDGLDLPDSAFADETAPPPRPAARINGLAWYWWLVGLALLLLLALAALGLR